MAKPNYKFQLTDDQWCQKLSTEAHKVLRKEDTQAPHIAPCTVKKRQRTYICAGCGQALYEASMKFDSGTGGPGFFTHRPDTIETKRDFKPILLRTEHHCSNCDSHQKHVFNHGREATGLRYCNNGATLEFVADDS